MGDAFHHQGMRQWSDGAKYRAVPVCKNLDYSATKSSQRTHLNLTSPQSPARLPELEKHAKKVVLPVGSGSSVVRPLDYCLQGHVFKSNHCQAPTPEP